MIKTILAVLSALVLFGLILYRVQKLPFSLTQVKSSRAAHLRNDVQEWLLRGKPEIYEHSNSTDHCFLFVRGITNAGVAYSTIIRLDSTLFQKRGFLVTTDKKLVFWVERRGDSAEQIHLVQ